MMKQVVALVVSSAICFAVACVGGLATTPNIPNWYAGLVKPSWTPPDWVFGPVWSVLYLSMAVAAWLVWRKGDAFVPLIIFAMQLVRQQQHQ
jgi:tryptophan-rich sensory protein